MIDGLEDWTSNGAIDPYFKFKVTTPVGSLYPETPNMAELPIRSSSEAYALGGLALSYLNPLSDASKKVLKDATGRLEVVLADDVRAMTETVSTDGLAQDEIRIEITLGGWDRGAVGETNGLDASDIADIDPTEGGGRARRIAFKLLETSAKLRDPPREIKFSLPADGAQDGNSNPLTREDDAKLGFYVENLVKVDFLQNALNIARNVPVAYPRVVEYG